MKYTKTVSQDCFHTKSILRFLPSVWFLQWHKPYVNLQWICFFKCRYSLIYDCDSFRWVGGYDCDETTPCREVEQPPIGISVVGGSWWFCRVFSNCLWNSLIFFFRFLDPNSRVPSPFVVDFKSEAGKLSGNWSMSATFRFLAKFSFDIILLR